MLKITFTLILSYIVFLFSCFRSSNSNHVNNTDDSSLFNSNNNSTSIDTIEFTNDEFFFDSTYNKQHSIYWRLDKISEVLIDKNLSHKKGFEYDSIIGIDYIGFDHERFFYPVNNTGNYTSSIKNSKKLNEAQILKLFSILSDKNTYKNPRIVGCYEPRLAFLYFKNNKIIAQTQICLSCAQLRSTAKTVSGQYGGLFNQAATNKLDRLRIELKLTSK